jgi:hypothetical protein
MEIWYFIAALTLLLVPVYVWGFKTLPQERWQIICTVPIKKLNSDEWRGLNLTYYGLFIATASAVAVALVIVLIGAAGINFWILTAITSILLLICVPSARLIARWVEKKPHTFSVGAASFVGIVSGPWLVWGIKAIVIKVTAISFDPMAVIAAAMVGYTLGEGMGRLACISFGCCYGKPIEQMPQVIQRYFAWASFTFTGSTKKVVYTHHLEGRKIFAIQAITAVIYTSTALISTLLFLYSHYRWTFFLCLTVTQLWRFCSEFFRSDYRGGQKISVYQIMSLFTIPYALLILPLLPAAQSIPHVMIGLHLLWNPAAILFLQSLWIAMFLFVGRSQVTGAALSFHVHQHRI